MASWLLVVVCCSLSSSSHVQRDEKKKLDILTGKLKLAPRNSFSLISRKLSKDIINSFPSIIFSLLPSITWLKVRSKGVEKGERKKEPTK